MNATFSHGPTGFLGVAANPLQVFSRTFSTWTVSITVITNCLSALPNVYIAGKYTVLHRSSGQWTPQHNRQSVDQPGQPPTWGKLHRGDDIHWILQHISHDHEFQSGLCKWFLW